MGGFAVRNLKSIDLILYVEGLAQVIKQAEEREWLNAIQREVHCQKSVNNFLQRDK